MAVENSIFLNIDEIKNFVFRYYQIKPIHIEKINNESANCYKIVCENENFFLKEFQSKFDEYLIKKEIFVCRKIEQYGIPTSQFFETKNGDCIIEKGGHQLHLQKFIDGCTLDRNCFTKSLLLDSAEFLGKINLCLNDVDFLPNGFPDSWFDEWTLSKSIAKHINIMNDVEISDMREDLKQKIIYACKTKVDLLEKYNMDYLKFKKLKKVNSHGDYNNLQIICEKDLSKLKQLLIFQVHHVFQQFGKLSDRIHTVLRNAVMVTILIYLV